MRTFASINVIHKYLSVSYFSEARVLSYIKANQSWVYRSDYIPAVSAFRNSFNTFPSLWKRWHLHWLVLSLLPSLFCQRLMGQTISLYRDSRFSLLHTLDYKPVNF